MIFYYHKIKFDTSTLSNKKEFYVYRITDPSTRIVLYIGKGKGSRSKNHLKKSHNSKLNIEIGRIRNLGLEPVLEILKKDLTEEQAYKMEIREVEKQSKNESLCNIAKPGPGFFNRTGISHTENTRKKISLAGQNRIISKTTRVKYEIYHTNRPLEHKLNLEKGKLLQSKFTEEIIKLIRCKYVKDVNSSIPEIAKELELEDYDVRAIGTGIRYKNIHPESIPDKITIKQLISKRKSITSRNNMLKKYE